MTSGPAGQAEVDRTPASVRVLGVILILELAVYACLTVLALISAGIGYAARDKGGFGDIAALLSLIVAGCSAAFAGLALSSWLALRARRPVAVALGVTLHVLPVVLLAVTARSVGTLGSTSIVWAILAAATLVLVLSPPTRAWVTGRRTVT